MRTINGVDFFKVVELLNELFSFRQDNDITCAEVIFQNDKVIENSGELLEKIFDKIGYEEINQEIEDFKEIQRAKLELQIKKLQQKIKDL